jgi:hypothetical protein
MGDERLYPKITRNLQAQLFSFKDESMHDSFQANVAAADALTLLLHNQHAICAAIEEVTTWLSNNGAGNSAINALTAMETLDRNAQGITDAILRLRQS